MKPIALRNRRIISALSPKDETVISQFAANDTTAILPTSFVEDVIVSPW